MTIEYAPAAIELEAQQYWDEAQSFKAVEDLSREKFYCLSMFPYPSGQLHMGHVRNYTIGDVIARYQRLRKKNVLQPMGWDAFGLPAENAAIANKVAPAKWTYTNIEQMRDQFKRLGFAFDWKREFATCQPDYYRWEQWLFVKLFKKNLAYKKDAWVNWDPVDQTVLANEQVVNGRGWRSGAVVERREISQWFLKITAYADELLDSLEELKDWPEQVRTMQKNWIGRSHGINIDFTVAEHDETLTVFTTRPDTLYGATYLAIAPEHPLAVEQAKSNETLARFIEACRNIKVAEADMATLEKQGVNTGLKAEHPLTGELIPVWVTNFVLMAYGSGAVMSVPGHDERDHEFAKKYELSIKQVVTPTDNQTWDIDSVAFCDKGTLTNSDEFNGEDSLAAIESISDKLESLHKGRRETHYRLRDWGVSRQRYWGTPIPIIYCDVCGAVPVPEKDLPVMLPEDVEITGGASPLKDIPEFYHTQCPECDKPAKRETDTFDTFVESSWYYARYACYNQEKAMLDDRANYWTPVDQYVGGIEHAVMHLLYARFFHKVLRDEGLVNSDEPFRKLLTQGMVLKDGSKMSKSKGNIVDPNHLIEKYGADTVRLFIIFAAPPEQSMEWSDSGVEGAYRFLRRIWQFSNGCKAIKLVNTNLKDCQIKVSLDWEEATQTQQDSRRQFYMILKQARFDYERLQFNTVVSACMKIFKIIQEIPGNEKAPVVSAGEVHISFDQELIHKGFSVLLRLLSPITPHITHKLWQTLEYGEDILQTPWPKVAADALKMTQVELIVQINGKLRGKIIISTDADDKSIQAQALNDAAIQRFLEGKTLQKAVIIPGRLINLVVK